MMNIMRKMAAVGANLTIRAFTLMETLLVLSITSLLLGLFSGSLMQVLHLVHGELFVLQFEKAYKNTRLDAGLLDQNEEIMAKNQQLQVENQLVRVPEEVQLSNFSVKFDRNAENSSLQAIRLYLPYEHKTIKYQLEMGSGKYKKTIS